MEKGAQTFDDAADDVAAASPIEEHHPAPARGQLAFTTCVLLGFLGAYLAFFLMPRFLNSDQLFPFPTYLPRMNPIGFDLKQMLSYSEQWALMGQSPYIGANLYPPLTTILFSPLLGLPYGSAYAVIVFLSLACFFAITLLLPLDAGRTGRLSPLLLLVVVLGLLSYGLQFELERGQFNLIAMTLCMAGIWMVHRHPRLNLVAYSLFSLSVQLKLYPAVFIVLLVRDWHRWRANLMRLAGLAFLNFALFFVLGKGIFLDFLGGIGAQMRDPNIWIGNHSIRSFVGMFFLSEDGPQWMSNSWIQSNPTALELGLLILIGICMAMVLLRSIQHARQGIDPYLFLALTLGALLIPSVSHDYTLSILSAPVALLFHTIPCSDQIRGRRRGPFLFLALLFSFAYGSTLFSYTDKPLLLANNLPALVVMLLVTTIWAWMGEDRPSTNSNQRSAFN